MQANPPGATHTHTPSSPHHKDHMVFKQLYEEGQDIPSDGLYLSGGFPLLLYRVMVAAESFTFVCGCVGHFGYCCFTEAETFLALLQSSSCIIGS